MSQMHVGTWVSQMVFEMRLCVYALHVDALVASLKKQAFVGVWMSQMVFVLAWDACETWVSRTVFAKCWCVCSSRRCHGETLNETICLYKHRCHKWSL